MFKRCERRAETPTICLDNARDCHRAETRVAQLANAEPDSVAGLERAALVEAVEAYWRRCKALRLVFRV